LIYLLKLIDDSNEFFVQGKERMSHLNFSIFILLFILLSNVRAMGSIQPSRYIELLKYVQPAPQQGKTGTCLYVASTGAVELIMNKKDNIINPVPYGPNDLSESYLINAPLVSTEGKSSWEKVVLKFNNGFGIHIDDWPFDAWINASKNQGVWDDRDIAHMPKVTVPRIDTTHLFSLGNRWSINILEKSHIEIIKEALWKNKSPVLVNYNHGGFWHVVLIVGYDDQLPGKCMLVSESDCDKDLGSFYVRDSAEGMSISVRDYDWFRILGNTAILIREVK
jgi:hypothetical protein